LGNRNDAILTMRDMYDRARAKGLAITMDEKTHYA
jgi:hypothetical protein